MNTLKTPITVHRQVKAALDKIIVEQQAVDSKLDSLLAQHGPGTANKYAPDVLKQKHDAILSQHTNNVVDAYNNANNAVIDLQKNADHFSREAVMGRAPLPTTPTPNVALTPQENQSMLAAMRRIESELIFTRLVSAIGKASDDALVDKLAPQAVRENHLRAAGEITAEASRRGGVLPTKVNNVLKVLPVPEADEHADHLERLVGTVRDMKSAFNSLSSGNADVRARVHAATAAYTGSKPKTFTGAV